MKQIESPAEYKIKPVTKVERLLTKAQIIFPTPEKLCNEKGEIVVLELRDLLLNGEQIAPIVWINGVAYARQDVDISNELAEQTERASVAEGQVEEEKHKTERALRLADFNRALLEELLHFGYVAVSDSA